MPKMEIREMPDSARVWVFGAAAPVVGVGYERLMFAVDSYLSGWRAHGAPLLCARDWRDDRMFRTLANAEADVGTSLVGGGTIFWRDAAGTVQSGTRKEFVAAAGSAEVSLDTPVMDLTISTVGDWRTRFERPASETWHATLVAGVATKS